MSEKKFTLSSAAESCSKPNEITTQVMQVHLSANYAIQYPVTTHLSVKIEQNRVCDRWLNVYNNKKPKLKHRHWLVLTPSHIVVATATDLLLLPVQQSGFCIYNFGQMIKHVVRTGICCHVKLGSSRLNRQGGRVTQSSDFRHFIAISCLGPRISRMELWSNDKSYSTSLVLSPCQILLLQLQPLGAKATEHTPRTRQMSLEQPFWNGGVGAPS